jgi:anti-sigma factor RsiW
VSHPHLDDDKLIGIALDELDPRDRTDAEAHAGSCPFCAAAIERLRGAIEGFRSAPLPDPPARVLLQLLGVQAGMHAPARVRAWWRSPRDRGCRRARW